MTGSPYSAPIALDLVAIFLPLPEDSVFKWDGQEAGVLSEEGCHMEEVKGIRMSSEPG